MLDCPRQIYSGFDITKLLIVNIVNSLFKKKKQPTFSLLLRAARPLDMVDVDDTLVEAGAVHEANADSLPLLYLLVLHSRDF